MSEKRLEVLEELAADLIHASQIGDTDWIRELAHRIEWELYEIRSEQRRAVQRKAV